ncbi:hypothetical protein [Zavarzinella formosa]|uniref:hypothetical protein n=1 Tax=Zavarzinella formosa TaxID=360055 RepID=UPI0002E2090A|nr:hypothetical protein [Zavarzinella formosa]
MTIGPRLNNYNRRMLQSEKMRVLKGLNQFNPKSIPSDGGFATVLAVTLGCVLLMGVMELGR